MDRRRLNGCYTVIFNLYPPPTLMVPVSHQNSDNLTNHGRPLLGTIARAASRFRVWRKRLWFVVGGMAWAARRILVLYRWLKALLGARRSALYDRESWPEALGAVYCSLGCYEMGVRISGFAGWSIILRWPRSWRSELGVEM